MTVKLDISYEMLLDLVLQLPLEEQRKFVQDLAHRRHQPEKLSPEEWIRLLDKATIHTPVNEAPSIRREDWYDDNGR